MDTREGQDGNDPLTPPGSEGDATHIPTEAPWLVRNGPYLVFVAALALFLQYRGWELDDYWSLTKAGLGLGLVIFIHELGHFLVAKWCDVHVETFSIGFGPPLPGCCCQWGETTYMVALFPLGGYVKMVGEGAENEESDQDPRSFKNKSVGARMAIISAGVVMNVILALACFVFVYMTRGAERVPGIIDSVDSGSAIWKTGVHRGDVIRQIGDRQAHPPFPFVWFDKDLQPTVMLSRAGEQLPFVFSVPEAPRDQWTETKIEPRLEEDDAKPVIGVAPASQLKLLSTRVGKGRVLPVLQESAAAHAQPPFEFGDQIVGSTDPDQNERLTDLPKDPRDPEGKRPDYFAFARRMERLAGKDIVVRVRRAPDSEDDTVPGTSELVEIKVPPAYRYIFGTRMGMAAIAAVRNPAKEAGVKEGDILDGVQVTDAQGKIVRFVSDKKGDPKVEERVLDPERLPLELERWAHGLPADARKEVKLTLLRDNPPPENGKRTKHEMRGPVDVTVPWDDSWQFEKDLPFGPSSPVSIAGLGIAYRVSTTIKEVTPATPAAHAVLEKSAQIKFKKGDSIRILPRAADAVTRNGDVFQYEDGSLKDGELFELKEGDEVERSGVKVSLKDGAELKLEKGDVLNLRPDDVIKEYRFFYRQIRKWSPPWSWFSAWQPEVMVQPASWVDLKENQWAHLPNYLQQWGDVRKMSFRIKRDSDSLEVTLNAAEDKDWPVATRGWMFIVDSRLEKADSLTGAIGMGMDTTRSFILQIYRTLASLLTRRVSPKNLGGPITIGVVAFSIAGVNIFQFAIFLGIISVNLAVINFLPIPVLDGGHMVFLIYEKLRGKPASEQVRIAATYVGLALIASLMIFVLYLDVMRHT